MKWIAYGIVTFCALNWVSSIALDFMLGGDALNGKVEQGRFFVGQHGHYTEVSESTYEYSRLITYSAIACMPLLWAAGCMMAREEERKNADTQRRN